MQKDFDEWNMLKKEIDNNEINILFKEGDIWWANLGLNIGEESCGKLDGYKRPVLVIKKLSHSNCIIVPLSTKLKKGTWFKSYTLHGKTYTALLYQIRMLNIKRFTKREATLIGSDFEKIKKKLKKLLSL